VRRGQFASDFAPPRAGDSYLVLESFKDEEGAIKHNVFFWLGAETSQVGVAGSPPHPASGMSPAPERRGGRRF
jgi:hypothetical protein